MINLQDEVKQYLMERYGKETFGLPFKREFDKLKVDCKKKLKEFYVSSKGYLEANSVHRISPEIEHFRSLPLGSNILDFGGGAGTYTLHLLEDSVYNIFYYDISEIQTDFMRYIKSKYYYNNLVILKDMNISEKFNGLILADVIEHLPDYGSVLKKLFKRLNYGGMVFAKPEFENHRTTGMQIHFHDMHDFPKFMKDQGFVRYKDTKYVWVKRGR